MHIIKNELEKSLQKTLSGLYGSELGGKAVLAPSKKPEFGEYTTNCAMVLAKVLKRNPLEIAGEIASKDIHKGIEKMEAVAPGFINIRISQAFYSQYLGMVMDGSYFATDQPTEKVMLEFVSANPTGPLNAVSARAAAVGDALARLLKYTGHDVFTEFYVNDAGNQVRLLGESLLYRYRQLKGEDSPLKEEHYQGEYLIDMAKGIAFVESEFSGLKGDDLVSFFSRYAIDYLLSTQKKDLEVFRTRFDQWFLESTLHSGNRLSESLEVLKKNGHVFESEGKQWFKSTSFGDEKDRVLVREDGTPTYFLADIAYHHSKILRGFNRIYDFWGPDHHGYIPRMKGAMQALGFDPKSFEVFIVQQVNLLDKGEKVKMSKRQGKIILMRDIVAEAGVDVTRYFMLMRNTSSHLDFDMELAVKQSNENPVYYIQYVHARICSIFRQSKEKNIPLLTNTKALEKYSLNATEKEIVKQVLIFNEMAMEAAKQMEPNIMSQYLSNLAAMFHKFYNEYSVLNEPDQDARNARALLIAAVREGIRRGLDLLGISAPESMSRNEENEG